MTKAVIGVTLVGGALATIFWWNHTAGRRATQVAAAETPAAIPAAQTQSPTPAPTTAPVTLVPTTQQAAVVPVAAAPITAASPAALQQGKQLFTAGKLVEARKVVNDALIANALPQPGDAEAAKALLRQINNTLVFSPDCLPGDDFVTLVTVAKNDRLTRIANTYFCTYEMILKINGLDSDRKLRVGQQLKVIKGPFHAVVNKKAFTLDIYLGAPGGEGSMYVTTYNVGLGTDNSTPSGLWKVERGNKLKNPTYFSPRGEGVIHAGDPANPLGPFWIGLNGIDGSAVGKTSYGIHGTIHPESIGKMESMGCIRLKNEDIAQVFILLYEVKSTVRVTD